MNMNSSFASRWTDNGAAGGTATGTLECGLLELKSTASGSHFLNIIVGVQRIKINVSILVF
jgi:hypothetical protein